MPDLWTAGPALPEAIVPTATDRRHLAWLLAAIGLAYLPLIFLGYGGDADTYLVLRTGQQWWQGAPYAPSRPPGYFLFEVAIGALAPLGRSLLTNGVTLALGLVSLWALARLAWRLGVAGWRLSILLVAVLPYFVMSSTTTMDYVWASAAWLTGACLFLDRRWVPAALCLGLAIGFRLGLAMPVAALGVFFLLGRTGWQGPVTLIAAAGLGALAYIPPYLAAGASMKFLTFAHPGWGPFEHGVRFAYRAVYLFGLPGTLTLAATLVLYRGRVVALWQTHRGLAAYGAAGLAACYALFALAPFAHEYLLPAVYLWALVAGAVLPGRAMAMVIVAVAALNVISLELIRPDRPNAAKSGKAGLFVERGVLVRDLEQRREMGQMRARRDPRYFLP